MSVASPSKRAVVVDHAKDKQGQDGCKGQCSKDKIVIVQLDKTRPRTAVTTRRKRTNLMRGQKRWDKHWTERQIAQSRFERIDDSEQIYGLLAHN